jgi:DNA-binding transcriptional ArsR family regulator
MNDTTANIDLILSALADPVRRDIFERVSQSQLTVNHIAIEYDMSLAAVSKHIRILREAGLVSKRREGRYQFVSANVEALTEATSFFSQFHVNTLT